MKIAIYDDQLNDLELLRNTICEFFIENDLDADITCFTTPDEFLKRTQIEFFPLVFFNVNCKNGQGVHIAKEFRKSNNHNFLILMGNSYESIKEILSLKAEEYMLLPLQVEEIRHVLNQLLTGFFNQNIKFVVQARELHYKRVFTVDEIKYIETYYNDLEIVTMDNEHIMLHVKNRNVLRNILKPRWFLQISQSLLVNMKCIDFLTSQNVILKTREVFPISKKKIFDCHFIFDNFLKKGTNIYESCYLSKRGQL